MAYLGIKVRDSVCFVTSNGAGRKLDILFLSRFLYSGVGSGLTKILGIHSSITWVLCFKTELHSLLPDRINRFHFLHLFRNFKSQFNKFLENNSAKNCVHMSMVAKGG